MDNIIVTEFEKYKIKIYQCELYKKEFINKSAKFRHKTKCKSETSRNESTHQNLQDNNTTGTSNLNNEELLNVIKLL